MDLTHPLRSLVPSLDGPVLEALARTSAPLSGHQVHRLARAGSPRGVRLVLARLVQHGLVTATEYPAMTLYEANREHLAWPSIEAIAHLRVALLDGIRVRIEAWPLKPVHASLFGSTARGDADEQSDLDLLLVRSEGDEDAWYAQIDDLTAWVRRTTGNPCQVFDVTLERLAEHVLAEDPLVGEWRRDGLHLVGTPIDALVRGRQGKARARSDG